MIAYIALGFTIFMQILALVWGASKLANELKHLSEAVNKLSFAFEAQDTRIDNHDIRLEGIDNRISNLEQKHN